MSHVDLGFAEECESWEVKSYLFPSKIGGKPAWLNLENLPTTENLQCENCHQPMIFLCQVYAPFEDDDDNFHRTVFIFICRRSECCQPNSNQNIKAFRTSLPRQNKFYSFVPPQHKPDLNFTFSKWVKLCNLCGCVSSKQCSKCRKVFYCSKDHQIIDWKDSHKHECEKADSCLQQSSKLFPEFQIVIEAEEKQQKQTNEEDELRKFKKLELAGKAGTLQEIPDDDIEKYATLHEDTVFMQFKEQTKDNPDQILRYERNGAPLWIAANPKPETIPSCDFCGSPRQYEFQIMPQILAVLHENDLDIGIIVVYTCSKSCIIGDFYKRECVFKQDVTIKT